jgi:putative oxidoreductase
VPDLPLPAECGNNEFQAVAFVACAASARSCDEARSAPQHTKGNYRMTNISSLGALAARILLAFMFILAGWGKLGDIPGTMAYTASGGLPGIFAIPAIAIELLGGLAVLVGWQTRWASLALALFCVATAILFHYVPAQGLEGMERMGQILNFQKNLAIAGGFLALAAFGAGRYALDARTSERRASVVSG